MSIFKDRNITSWTPKNRVLNEIKELPMHLNDRENCLLNCLEMNVDSLKSIIAAGSVDFGESDVSNEEKRQYQLSFESEKIKNARVEIREDSVVLINLQLSSTNCDCPF
jgi:hypothetical protein